MNKVQKTVGLWVQRITGKTRSESPAQPARQPVELDAQAQRQISGGTSLPTTGW